MSDKARQAIVDEMARLRIRIASKKNRAEKLLIESQEQAILASHYASLLDEKRKVLAQYDKGKK